MNADAAVIGVLVVDALLLIALLLIVRWMAREGLLTLTLRRGQARPPAPKGDNQP